MTNESKNQNQRIAKFIANSGISSRREAERMILSGRVQIDGKIITTPAVNMLLLIQLLKLMAKKFQHLKIFVFGFFINLLDH